MQWPKDQSLEGRNPGADPGRVVWPWRGWVWTRRALTEIPQAVLTGVHAQVQHAHQPKVIHLGQGLLQKPPGSQPRGLDSGHAPRGHPCLWPRSWSTLAVGGREMSNSRVAGGAAGGEGPAPGAPVCRRDPRRTRRGRAQLCGAPRALPSPGRGRGPRWPGSGHGASQRQVPSRPRGPDVAPTARQEHGATARLRTGRPGLERGWSGGRRARQWGLWRRGGGKQCARRPAASESAGRSELALVNSVRYGHGAGVRAGPGPQQGAPAQPDSAWGWVLGATVGVPRKPATPGSSG